MVVAYLWDVLGTLASAREYNPRMPSRHSVRGQEWISSMSYELIWEPEGVVQRYTGMLTADSLLGATKRVHCDPRYDHARYVIADLSAIEGHSMTPIVLTELLAHLYGAHASHPNCRMVFVTVDRLLALLIERVLKTSDDKSYEVEIMPSEAAARDWLASQPALHAMSDVMGFLIR